MCINCWTERLTEGAKVMKATENKALILAAVAVISLGQPAFARGGGFGGGFGSGFSGGSHGFGGFGVHGFNGGFSPRHAEGKSTSEEVRDQKAGAEQPMQADHSNRPESTSSSS